MPVVVISPHVACRVCVCVLRVVLQRGRRFGVGGLSVRTFVVVASSHRLWMCGVCVCIQCVCSHAGTIWNRCF